MYHSIRIALALPLALLWSCHDDDDSGPLAMAEIGTSGGTIAVTSGSYAGTSITIAPNALTTATVVEIRSDDRTVEAGVVDVGPAARFVPGDAPVATPAIVTLPFEQGALPPGVVAADLRVSTRTSDGTLARVSPSVVDLANGLVTVSITQLATLWVVAPDNFESARYFPLAVGDTYSFVSSLNNNMTVVDATSDTWLPGPADVRVTLTLPWFHRKAMYLDPMSGGGIELDGSFDSPPESLATLEWLDMAVPFLNPIETVGASHTAAYTYVVSRVDLANLPPTQIGTGSAMLSVEVVARETVDTPVGEFDTIKITWTDTFTDTAGGGGSGTFTLWLARDVGPVQIQVGSGEPLPIRSATVRGQPVRGD